MPIPLGQCHSGPSGRVSTEGEEFAGAEHVSWLSLQVNFNATAKSGLITVDGGDSSCCGDERVVGEGSKKE